MSKRNAKSASTTTSPSKGARTPSLGLVAWFRPGEHEKVEAVLAAAEELGVTSLRTGLSWADWYSPEGEAWYGWLLPRLAREVEILPCLTYTPPALGVQPTTSAPPRDPKAYADFLDVFVTKYGEHFEWIELWNEPNDPAQWDSALDPDWLTFCTMIGAAAYWMRHRGKRVLLGGMCPIDPDWLRLMFERGVMQYIDAVGLHGFPGTLEPTWGGWRNEVARVAKVLQQHGSRAAIWISETGFSTWRHDERGQLRAFLEAIEAPVERVFWKDLVDLDPETAGKSGFHVDEREYHFGLARTDGTKKLLHRLWSGEGESAPSPAGAVERIREAYRASAPVHAVGDGARPVVITGGAGFVGSNVADRHLRDGRRVVLLDNLSRPGVERNFRWLRDNHGDAVQLELGDVRDRFAIRRALRAQGGAETVYHFAAQVAVTTSLVAPIADAHVNVLGTLNLLEEVRAMRDRPAVIFTSTNKVYGELSDVDLELVTDRERDRWTPTDPKIRAHGIGEDRPLDFHSPYGCSKGAADQYVVDYARTFGIPALVFRMSCIYGPRQFGTEDQGWVAHFLIRALEGRPITLYGDGKQVRDVLFVGDLVDAFLAARAKIDALAGRAFNVGGGPRSAISLVELLRKIEAIEGRRPATSVEAWRPGDQRYYVSDTRALEAATGWRAKVDVDEGLARLHAWLRDARRSSVGEPGASTTNALASAG
jgi:CDP-paratose 2-epimerase